MEPTKGLDELDHSVICLKENKFLFVNKDYRHDSKGQKLYKKNPQQNLLCNSIISIITKQEGRRKVCTPSVQLEVTLYVYPKDLNRTFT